MKASELIKHLEECINEHGDLDVRLYADHGQCSMSAEGVGLSYIEEDSYMADTLNPEDLGGYDDYIEVIEIYA